MSQARAPLPPFHRRLPGVVQDPYPVYRRYREREPVHRGEAADPRIEDHWFLFSWEDVSFVLKDPRFARDVRSVVTKPLPDLPEGPIGDLVAMVRRWMLFTDPPLHTRLRGRVRHAFRPHTVKRLEGNVERLASELLETALAREDGRFDGIRHFALPLTVGAIAALLGVPDEQRDDLRRTMAALRAVFGGDTSPKALAPAADAAVELRSAFEALLDARCREPQDDLISELVAQPGASEPETRSEIVATCIFLLGAGFATTVHGIGNAIHSLLAHPAELARLRAEPERLPSAVEELLRFESPVQRVARFPMEEVVVRGHRLRRGSMVTPVIGAANHDPAVFDDPDRLDLSRDARRQIAFGGGIHSCLGAPLARLEIRIALETLLREAPDLALAGAVHWSEGIARGLDELPLQRGREGSTTSA